MTISAKQVLTGRIALTENIKGEVNIATNSKVYDGDSHVIPLADESVVLPTAQKFVLEDIKVDKIPYSEVANTSNGITVFIG